MNTKTPFLVNRGGVFYFHYCEEYMPEHQILLEAQREQLLTQMENLGLDRTKFQWHDEDVPGSWSKPDRKISKIVYRDTRYFYRFDVRPIGYYCLRCPGSDRPTEEFQHNNWDIIVEDFLSWAKRLKVELETPEFAESTKTKIFDSDALTETEDVKQTAITGQAPQASDETKKQLMERIAFVSSDMVDSTGLERRHSLDDVDPTFKGIREYMKSVINRWSGQICTIAGDGIEFIFRNIEKQLKPEERAFGCVYSILTYLPVFNLCESLITEPIRFRFSIGTLNVPDLDKRTCREITDAHINTICKTQKDIADENEIVILETTYRHLPQKLRSLCIEKEVNGVSLYVFDPSLVPDVKIFDENWLSLKKEEHDEYDHKDVAVDVMITPSLHFIALIKLSFVGQPFVVYYQVHTPQGDVWIGYRQNGDHITGTEHTVAVQFPNSRYGIIVENVLDRVRVNFPQLVDNCDKIVNVRFRASKDTSAPITFYYGFFDKK